ncbi:hypothetical protein GCM10011507_34110 [Edaphobacter acidisoli]|uniref:Uncharacterized protein n=1 Tax=Edaphobacter acidisoli TaxID=2040573 RepID=A0A916S1D1_9BACT|nr:hypothetical protein GCM10011507_34110 [Edaphobacter acidisoli]
MEARAQSWLAIARAASGVAADSGCAVWRTSGPCNYIHGDCEHGCRGYDHLSRRRSRSGR